MTPQPLLLHVGMPKTGTSSLQETFFFGLRDPRFHAIGFGLVNGSRAIQCLVGDNPVAGHVHPSQGIDPAAMINLAPRFQACWERQAALARKAGATPIVSAEDCWFLNKRELERLKALIEAEGFRPRVVVYLRPPLEWLASMFQEMLKSGHHTFVEELLIRPPGVGAGGGPWGCDYPGRLAVFEDVFGADRLTVRPFRRGALAEGCVVTDFCRCFGIAMPRRRIRRVNEGLSLDATRFLYVHNRFARAGDGRSHREFLLLLRRLRELPGGALRLHPALIEKCRPALADRIATIQTKYGVDLVEDWTSVPAESIRVEEDLWTFSRASLDWLAAASGGGPVSRADPRQIAERVARVRSRFRHRAGDFLKGRLMTRRLRRLGCQPSGIPSKPTPQPPAAVDRVDGELNRRDNF